MLPVRTFSWFSQLLVRKHFLASILNPRCCNCSPDPSLRTVTKELFFIFSTVYSASEDELCARLVFSRLSNPSHFSLILKGLLSFGKESQKVSIIRLLQPWTKRLFYLFIFRKRQKSFKPLKVESERA